MTTATAPTVHDLIIKLAADQAAASPSPKDGSGLSDVIAILELLGIATAPQLWPLALLKALCALAETVFDHPASKVIVGGTEVPFTPAQAPKCAFDPGGLGFDPCVAIDGNVTYGGKSHNLWARRRPLNNHAAIDAVTVPGGLALHGDLVNIDGSECLQITFTFSGSQPEVALKAAAPLIDIAKALLPVIHAKP